MTRTIVAGKYTITHKEMSYFDKWEVTEQDAFRGWSYVDQDVTTVRCRFERDELEDLTIREILDDALFGQWTFGYPYVGVTDGALLCQECAIKQLVDMADEPDMHDESDWLTVTVLQEMQPAGEYCSGCESYAISEPYCQECSSESKPLVFSDDGYHAICRDCLASKLWSKDATREVKTYHYNGQPYVEYQLNSRYGSDDGRFTYPGRSPM
jgi:hypothetical protein